MIDKISAMSGPKRSWSDADLAAAIETSVTWGQVARTLGFSGDGGSSSKSMKRRATELSMDTSHFLGRQWNKGGGVGRDRQKQRAAQHRWYIDHRQLYLDRSKRRAEDNTRRLRELKNVPCMDCGGRFPPCAMDFDHREGAEKIASLGACAKRWSWKKVSEEIAKCDIICSNCHRIRTARRAGWPCAELMLSDIA